MAEELKVQLLPSGISQKEAESNLFLVFDLLLSDACQDEKNADEDEKLD